MPQAPSPSSATGAGQPRPAALIPIKPVNVTDAEAVARQFDGIGLERALVLAELRKLGAAR